METTSLKESLREPEKNLTRLIIEDKGKGFNKDQLSSGVGLISMEERARPVDGELHVKSEPGKGTIIVLEVPTE